MIDLLFRPRRGEVRSGRISRVVADAGVVAGGDAVGADLAGGGEELIELHVIVAEGARNRSAAFEVIVDERADYGVFEFALEVHDVERDAEMFGYAAGVVDVVDRAAAVLGWGAFSSCGRRRWFQSCIVRPTMAWPRSWRMAATVELSTPPLIATATVAAGAVDFAADFGCDIAFGE